MVVSGDIGDSDLGQIVKPRRSFYDKVTARDGPVIPIAGASRGSPHTGMGKWLYLVTSARSEEGREGRGDDHFMTRSRLEMGPLFQSPGLPEEALTPVWGNGCIW